MPVIGTGEFAVGFIGTASLEFQQSVASGIFVEVTANPGALLTIDQPNAFLGSVQLGDPTSSGIGETIRLLGLQSADSYSFLNDILSLYSGNTVIDTLRMQNVTPFGFDVFKANGAINIMALNAPAARSRRRLLVYLCTSRPRGEP
jgi:hypothetical protein